MEPEVFVNAKSISRGLVKPPEVKKPIERSVAEELVPLAKLYAPPAELDDMMSVEAAVVPPNCVVAVVFAALVQSAVLAPNLKPIEDNTKADD